MSRHDFTTPPSMVRMGDSGKMNPTCARTTLLLFILYARWLQTVKHTINTKHSKRKKYTKIHSTNHSKSKRQQLYIQRI